MKITTAEYIIRPKTINLQIQSITYRIKAKQKSLGKYICL